MIQDILDGFHTAFLDIQHNSNLAYRPQFLSNDYKAGKKVLTSLENELSNCDEFIICVAFITLGGIAPLLQTFRELEQRGVKGRILTTDYLTFSDPKAIKKLNSYNNIEIRMHVVDKESKGFHTKGYIFYNQGLIKTIIGSSNLTLSALTQNKEWNTKFVSTEHGEMIRDVLVEFYSLWDSAVSVESFIDSYERTYQAHKKVLKNTTVPTIQQYKLKPNSMQLGFIHNLEQIMNKGARKALLISATGTGKTYASAFALRNLNPKKALFLVHREQIAKQAIKSYRNVFGDTKTFGLLSGNSKEMTAQYLFATMQMMSKKEILDKYEKEEFDIIVIDEVHRAGAESYQRIMNYFSPKLWLGMTASPDRPDGFDIYELFDHNIAYEIRLQQAMEEDLLCPFHYFGITDLEIDGETVGDNDGFKSFNLLTSDQRVDYIIQNAQYFGYSGNRVKGLIFCSRKEEAKILSGKFNEKGFKTTYLSGDDSQLIREQTMERLVSDDSNDYLDYIFSVDIFNEGVDIPEVNQVIMLRPTESPIVFVQQLGRGLRKSENKEYVIVLDFIGNYANNFMIPIALSGDRSYNKDTIRKYVMEGNKIIPGSSTIHFDEISKKRIYASIDQARTNDIKLIKESYQNLKYKLGHIPSIQDFSDHGAIDITKIFEKCGSYYAFLVKYEKDYDIRLSAQEECIIQFLSKKIVRGKRIHELEMLRHLVKQEQRIISYFKLMMKDRYGIDINKREEESVILNLTNQFPKEEDKKNFKSCVFLEKNEDGEYSIAKEFQKLLKNKIFRNMVIELIEYGIKRYYEYYSNRYKDTNFQLYQKYTYEDVCRLLNWKRNMNAQNIGGYFYDSETKTLPVFINYEKTDDAIAYEDRFVSNSELIALSKHPRKISSNDVTHIYKRSPEDKDNKIYLFIRKNKDDQEAKEFYFLGEMYAVGEPYPIRMESTNDDAFEITYQLDVPVRDDIYDYIKSE